MINLLSVPTPEAIAERHLRDAERELLEASKNAEFWKHMVSMYSDRITRLREYLNAAPDQ